MPNTSLKLKDYVQDNAAPTSESWEMRRTRIAKAAEEACHLHGNNNSIDFEEFIARYGSRSLGDFA